VTSQPAGKAAAELGTAAHPDPEVVVKPKRRIFTAEYKQHFPRRC
jgi:hypothetical protein